MKLNSFTILSRLQSGTEEVVRLDEAEIEIAKRDKVILEQQARIVNLVPLATIFENFTYLEAALKAERDKTLLEQQARINELKMCLIDTYVGTGGWAVEEVYQQKDNLSTLEAHDREVRIKTLEDAADKLRGNGFNVLYEICLRDGSYMMAAEELEFMANELKG